MGRWLGQLEGDHNVRHQLPLPRVSLDWSGADSECWITVELATRHSDPVVGVVWYLPFWLGSRLDRLWTWWEGAPEGVDEAPR